MNHDKEVSAIILKELGKKPINITRMKTGLCNEVYKVKIKSEKEFIVRLNKDKKSLIGSDKFIPLFKSKGINVPTIVARDYSKKTFAYAYQIMTKINGVD